jgi:hypothetical protein
VYSWGRADSVAAGEDQAVYLEVDAAAGEIDMGMAAERPPRFAATGDPADHIARLINGGPRAGEV